MNELNTRNATLEPTTFNADNRTVSVVFASNAPVHRLDLDGAYQERLDMTAAAVDLTELIGGPVLNSHNRSDVNAVLGVVESAQVDGERDTATSGQIAGRLSSVPESSANDPDKRDNICSASLNVVRRRDLDRCRAWGY